MDLSKSEIQGKLIATIIKKELHRWPIKDATIYKDDISVIWYKDGVRNDFAAEQLLTHQMMKLIFAFADLVDTTIDFTNIHFVYQNGKEQKIKVHISVENGELKHQTEYEIFGGPTDEIPERARG